MSLELSIVPSGSLITLINVSISFGDLMSLERDSPPATRYRWGFQSPLEI